MTEALTALHGWLRSNFLSLEAVEKQDSGSSPYLCVSSTSSHPVLGTAPSVHLNIFIKEHLLVSKLMAFNLTPLREVSSTTEEEMNGEGKMKEILRVVAGQQTSVCVGIPEEGVKARALVDNLGLVLIEKFLNCVVVRARSCDRVILEQDGLYMCPSCQDLQHKLENLPADPEDRKEEEEEEENCGLDVKMEPEVQVNDAESEVLPHSIFNSEPLRKMSKLLRTKLSCPEDSCNRKFSKYKLLVNHCKLKHYYTDEELPVKLENVKVELEAKKRGRRERSERSSTDLEGPNQCTECDSSFWSHKSLVKHCVSVHNMSKDLVSPEQYLERKKMSHIPEKFTCQYCPKMFKFQSSVINHTKRYHTETKLVPCEHCGKEVKQSNMDMHYKNNHATPRYTCNQCGKTFYFKALMVNHIAVMHEGQKNHVCDLCGAKFGIKKSLERHVRCQHEDFRPHICEYCQKAFHTLQKLQKHISGHIKDKLYVCPVCEAKFYYQDNVRMHVKKSHPEHDPKVKCRVIDNPDYVAGQGVYSMDSGRRMRVNNSKLNNSSSGLRTESVRASQQSSQSSQSSPAFQNHFNSYNRLNTSDSQHQPPVTPNPTPSSSASFDNSPFYSGLHTTREDQKQEDPGAGAGAGNRNIANIPQLTAQAQHQFFDQTRPADFSNYLLGLRYNYANYHHQ